LSEQLLQPVQTDRLLSDLRHEAEAASPDDPPADHRGAGMTVGGLAKLFGVHAFTALEPA
jgi:hypothetical protein